MRKEKIKVLTLLSIAPLCCCCASAVPDYSSDTATVDSGEVIGEQTEIEEVELYEVLEVVDGDTIKIDYEGTKEGVRLIGIDTPETSHPNKETECFGKEATEKIKELVKGKHVKIEFDETQGDRDKYGRLLLYIWQGEIFVNEVMVREGFAHEYTYNLPYKYMDQFKEAEKEARENRKGLWGDACACQEGEEIARECIACHKARVTRTHWDCSTYEEDITDNSCTSGCYTTAPEPAPTPSPSYVCDCSKTCPQMSSCEEAYYQLNKCGCSQRDGDNDGVPCEKICPGG